MCVPVFRLEGSLSESRQRVCELSQALADSEEQCGQLQARCHSQNLQLQQLQDVCTQLSAVRETNEVSLRSVYVWAHASYIHKPHSHLALTSIFVV